MTKVLKKVISLAVVSAMVMMVSGCGQSKAGDSSHSRLEEIKQRGYIEVATEPYFAPYEFIDPSKPEGEKYVGSDIELAKYIAKDLGVELRIVPLEFSAVLAGVSDGKYDLALSALAYTPEREKAMSLSKGYYFSKEDSGHGLLVRTEDIGVINTPDNLADKTVVVQSGSLQELFLNEQVPATKEVKKVSSTMDGFLMVQEGKADVSITSIDLAQLYIDSNPTCGLQLVEGFKFTEDESTAGTRAGIPPNEPELTEYINSIIDKVMADGSYEKWYNENAEYAKTLGL